MGCVRVLCVTAWVLVSIFGCQADGPPSDAGDGGASVPEGTIGAECATTADDCNAGLVCAAGQCQLSHGPCTSDSNCNGDTYCCVGDCPSPGEAGTCIAYGVGSRGEVNASCVGEAVAGLFNASLQCEWTAPPAGDAYPDHVQVLATPLVADLGNQSASDPDGRAPAEILIVSYNHTDGGGGAALGMDERYYGVIRILNGQDCVQLESIADPAHPIIAASAPAIGDLDGDGVPEIVAQQAMTGLVAFKWNSETRAHETYWTTTESDVSGRFRWDGPSLHDLDDDGFPEVISAGEVFDGRTGHRLNAGQVLEWDLGDAVFGALSIVDDVDADGAVELVAGPVYRWDRGANRWASAYAGLPSRGKYAIADFGSPTGSGFDAVSLDGIAEIVSVRQGVLTIATLVGDIVLQADLPGGGVGGPPTIGDFDADGFPEVATAGLANYAVFDLDCRLGTEPGCSLPFVRWLRPSQDRSSNQTGSAIFDFEGDGQAEAVYADECFSRIYDGETGDVIYSAYRTSCTWYENPVIADPDRDENTEILVGSNTNCDVGCPRVDPIHRGTRCENDAGCVSGSCDVGFCRCESSSQCGSGTTCAEPLDGTPGSGNTCRAEHPAGEAQTGLRVLRDTLDRWVSSRPIWNQHAYSVANVLDDGTIPRTSERRRNVTEVGLNNFRQNEQGPHGVGDIPDITGRLADNACHTLDGEPTRLRSTVCNRGTRAVGAALPATFYLGHPSEGNRLCTSYTPGAVPVGGCLEVSCVLEANVVDRDVYVVVNDDGAGGATTVECNTDNNTHSIRLDECLTLF